MERNSFLIIAKKILTDKRVCMTGRLLLAQLIDHRNKRTGQCNPKQETLAQELGVSLDTIQRCLVKLKELGWVVVKRRQYGCSYEIQIPQNAVSQTAECGSQIPQNAVSAPPYPLYEPYYKEPTRVRAFPSLTKTQNPPPRKSAQSEILEAYYREERRKEAARNGTTNA